MGFNSVFKGLNGGTFWRSCLRRCSLGSTQPQTEMSTRNTSISWNIKVAGF